MSRLVDDGAGGKVAYRVHIESMAKQGDFEAQAELLAQPKVPTAGSYLWKAFQELSATRGSGMVGPNPISRMDIRLWEADECRHLEAWERSAILAIDAAFLTPKKADTDEGETVSGE